MTTKTNNNIHNLVKKKLGNLPIWDLSDLYHSTKSIEITTDLKFIEKKAKLFEKKYEGKINSLNGESILSAIEELEIIDENIRTDLGIGGMFMNFIVSPGQDTALLNRSLNKFIAGWTDPLVPFYWSGSRSILNNIISPQLKDVDNDILIYPTKNPPS